MDTKPIKTNADYRAALKQIEALMTAKSDTPEGERLDVLVTLVGAYEKKQILMEQDRTAMSEYEIVSVRPIAPSRLAVRFADGLSEEVVFRELFFDELMADWELARRQTELKKIVPLE